MTKVVRVRVSPTAPFLVFSILLSPLGFIYDSKHSSILCKSIIGRLYDYFRTGV
ncbi:hypothetical protein OAA47_00080 [Methylophilaceae bacterium]|nr:hypothetical protein [Methylophilaceae bacterium]